MPPPGQLQTMNEQMLTNTIQSLLAQNASLQTEARRAYLGGGSDGKRGQYREAEEGYGSDFSEFSDIM
ncbi:hypothetical protein MMC08_003777 [Hypocenomyce scalaris]|nr:hypothetical protein [Hypocenomyce scalaris]